jgi:hypothetical protein
LAGWDVWTRALRLAASHREAMGYVASAFVLATFCMGSIRPLRMTAIGSNIAFIVYASVSGLLPILILHGILLPVNVTRLAQIERARAAGRRRLEAARLGTIDAAGTDLAAPRFIVAGALADPDTALQLAEREETWVAALLCMRIPSEAPDGRSPSAGIAGEAAGKLTAAIDAFLAALATAGLTIAQAERLSLLLSRNALLHGLHETLGELLAQIEAEATGRVFDLGILLREALGAIVSFAADAARTRAKDDIALLLQITSDRSRMVERIRQETLLLGVADAVADYPRLYDLTARYERAVWLLNRYGRLLAETNEQVAA